MLGWINNFTFESYLEVTDLISEYNKLNTEDEIFFCEDGNRYYLEDDCIECVR